MDEISYVGLVAISGELAWRSYHCLEHGLSVFSEPSHVIVLTYLLCVVVILLDLKNMSFFQSEGMRSVMGNLHAMDCVLVLILGTGMYFERLDIVWFAMILLSKLFLLSFITRMITGRASPTKFAAILQTSRAYLHHIGSFVFIAGIPEIIVLTTLWRFISMSGHSLVYFRDKNLPVEDYRKSPSYARNVNIVAAGRQVALLTMLLAAAYSPTVRRGFAVSAMGHVSYMVVRLGPVYRLGGSFISEHNKEEWKSTPHWKKINLLLRVPAYSWLLFEIILLLFACVYFTYLRLVNEPTLSGSQRGKCYFI